MEVVEKLLLNVLGFYVKEKTFEMWINHVNELEVVGLSAIAPWARFHFYVDY